MATKSKKTVKLDGDQPLYRQIESDLLRRIRRGEYAPGSKIPSERQLTKIYDASSVTIRQAIGELAQRRILVRQHGSGTYVAETVTSQTHNLALILSSGISLVHPFTTAIVAGIEKQCREVGYNLQINSLRGYRFNEDKSPLLWRYLQEGCIDGIILQNPVHEEDIAQLQANSIPFVSLVEYRKIETHCVLSDTEDAAFNLTQLILRHGHKRIGLLVRPNLETRDHAVNTSEGFLAGYQRALARADTAFDPSLVISESHDVNLSTLPEKAVKNVERFFDYPEMPTAIVASSSVLLDTARKAAENRGMRVPEDISLAGVAELGYDLDFSTVSTNSEDLGEIATDRLVRLINGETFHQRKVIVKFPLVEGKSVQRR